MADPSSPRSGRAAVLAVALAVLVVVVGLVYAQTRGGGDPASAPEGQPSRAQVETPPPGECNDPPPLPEKSMEFPEPPDPALAEDSVWTAHVATNCGEIVLELYGDKAPQTVASFLFLARKGFWDDSPCHRLTQETIFVLQCGDPTGTGGGGPGYGFGVENAPADDRYPRGSLAMARTTDPETNGSQLFIVYQPTELPDPVGYTIFGKVVEGMDIVDRIAREGVGGTLGPEAPKQPISILDVTVQKGAA